MSLARAAFSFLVSTGLAAHSRMHFDTAPNAEDEARYTAFFPYYAEISTLSELKKKPGYGCALRSGVGGHAVLYLNGVRREPGAHYPILALCEPGDASHEGVGLSINEHYKNAVWVATEGRDFFLNGAARPGEALTRAIYERTQAQAKAMGILDGVAFHPVVFADKLPGIAPLDHMYEVSVATDYAIGFGRHRHSARLPLDHARMAEIVTFLNGLNAVYRSGTADFRWDIFRKNCCHVSHDALARAAVWSLWPKANFFLAAAFDFPVPKNEFVDLMRRTNDLPIADPHRVYDDLTARRALMQWNALPTEPGALAQAQPAVRDNEIYDTELSQIFYEVPFIGGRQRRFEDIFAHRRYLDLRENLRYFAALYRTVDQAAKPLAMFLNERGAVTDDERDCLTDFYERYRHYIRRKAREVQTAVASLPSNVPDPSHAFSSART
jgi:hypothetical protein